MQDKLLLDNYQRVFAELRVDRVPGRYPEATNGRAPHKPLLLAVLDLVAQHQIVTNFIEFKANLLDAFDLYWLKVMGSEREANPVMPFYHLKSDRFWHLIPQPGMDKALQVSSPIRSLHVLRELVVGAKLDEDLFRLIQYPDKRDTLRTVLIEHYFAPDTRQVIVQTGTIHQESFEYSNELLEHSRCARQSSTSP
jgi:putative restriction endonuclease